MENITESLFAENTLDEFGFIRYIYHTHKPRALFLIDYEPDPETLVLVDEIDSFKDYSDTEIDGMMIRLRGLWRQYKTEILEEPELCLDPSEMKHPDLDDVVTISIINGTEKPDPAEFEMLDKSCLLKMSINNQGFWASILEFDLETESIIGVVQSYLDEEDLKTKDHFMAFKTRMLS
ncbi:hypothetical protein [Daejeonella lutea]|uniref:Uncharacterized protein n=1 Tax=Daejeonella lutea TaxID=572036 RepID=A0A1T5CSU8_9SPHI|nr:hypothetical protein [Daejeonella lutea]SKB62494.1 hypothetical protein SAMN05661099_1834 [Daejeonella lutea]